MNPASVGLKQILVNICLCVTNLPIPNLKNLNEWELRGRPIAQMAQSAANRLRAAEPYSSEVLGNLAQALIEIMTSIRNDEISVAPPKRLIEAREMRLKEIVKQLEHIANSMET
jgi:hypothetical protein